MLNDARNDVSEKIWVQRRSTIGGARNIKQFALDTFREKQYCDGAAMGEKLGFHAKLSSGYIDIQRPYKV